MIEAWWSVKPGPWEEAEFERLFLAHYQGLARTLVRLLGSVEEAEDVAQEAFLRLYRQRFLPGREHNARAWLYRVATNLAYNARRDRQRRERRQERTAPERDGNLTGGDLAEEAVRSEEQEVVRRTLATLPARQARLLLLYYAGLSYRELAHAAGIALGSVGTLLARAKAAFERQYRALATAQGGKGDEM